LWLIGAWFCVVAGALVREDTMATVPLLWLLGFLVQRRDSPARGQGRLLLFAAGSVLLAAVLLAWRAVAVPDAVSLGFDLGGYAVSVLRAFQIAGDELEGIAGRWALAWLFSLAGLAAVASFARRRMAGVTVSVAAVAIAATPTLVFGRRNLLFFAVSASAVGIALLALEVWEIGSRPAKVLACLALACGIGGGVWASRTFALHFHPYSVSSLEWTAQFIFGPASSRATIPAQRRAEAFRRLRSLGIRGADYESAVENLKAEAEAANRARPTQPGLPFSPAIRNVW
jgi:hypothetical protein